MKTLDEFKENWAVNPAAPQKSFDGLELEKMFKRRISQHTFRSMQYFWASFVLQLIVYALLTHVVIKYWSDAGLRWPGLAGIVLYIPFTWLLLNRFKKMANAPVLKGSVGNSSLQQYTVLQYRLLSNFFRFKKRYEMMLIPLSLAIGVAIFFRLYVPGSVPAHPAAATITFGVILLSLVFAVRAENQRSFERPLARLKEVLDEFGSND